MWNSAVGYRALYKNTTGSRNTAVGFEALYNTNGPFNVSGFDNVAVGAKALFNNTTGSHNVAIGPFALYDNTTGSNNIAIGNHALWQLDAGDGVTAVGDCFYSDANGVEIGRRRDCDTDISPTGHIHAYDIFIGDPFEFFAPGSCISHAATQSVHIVVDDLAGSVFVAGVNNHPIAGSQVVIDPNGQLGVAPSSKRFKNDIKPMTQSSEAVLALKPVTFRYKAEIDRNSTPQFGLIAEDVEKVNPDLVVRDKEGKPYSVRYEPVNAMLLNEFIKEHRKVEKLEANAAEQQKEIKALGGIVKQQASQLEKVNAQLDASKVAPTIVASQ